MKNFNQYKDKLLNIWTCDHRQENKESPPEYVSKINHIDYYTFDNYEGTHLNSIQYFINEITCLTYPYLNNIKSNYIAFDHYSRRIRNESICNIHLTRNPKYFLNATFFLHNHFEEHCDYWIIPKQIQDDILEFISIYKPKLLSYAKRYVFTERCNIFIMPWKHYVQLAEFDMNYINFIANKYGLGYDPDKWKKHIRDVYIKPNYGKTLRYMNSKISYDTFNSYRIYGFNLEFLNGLFITAILHGKQSKFSLSYINESEKTQSKYL